MDVESETEPVKSEQAESAVETNAVPTPDCAEVKHDIIEGEDGKDGKDGNDGKDEKEKEEEVTEVEADIGPLAVDSTVTDSKTETQSISEMLDTTDTGRNKTQNPYEVELPTPDY